jgi:TonB-dependent starch-binding outer membrane protein SusC
MGLRRVLAVALLAVGAVLTLPLYAQQLATITGKVTDAKTGEPIPAAAIQVEGTQEGAITANDGTYRIARAPLGAQTVVARRLGYSPGRKQVTLVEGGSIVVDFALTASATALEEIVVTGTAGNLSRGAQPAVVAKVDANELNDKAPIANATDLIEGRVPGVNVTQASGTIGAAPRISIRGATSISLSSAPLVFIDGVRMNSSAEQVVGNYHNLEGLGGQTVTALNDLNPDDIESIEIVKGPAAATLYGADASAGVIQIITKKGHEGTRGFTQNIAAEWNQVRPNFTPLPLYGTCGPSDVAPGGAALCQGHDPGFVISDNPLVRGGVFRNGDLNALDYSGQGGGDNFGYFLSGSLNNETGTSINNDYRRRTARSSFNWTINPKLSVDAMVGIAYNKYRVPEGDDANYGYLTQGEFESNPFAVTLNPDGTRSGGISTPVVGLASVVNQLTTLRYTPSAQIHYDPFSWFSNRLTVGGDISSTHGFTFFPRNDQGWFGGDQANGYVEDVQNPINIYSVDYLGDLKKSFGSNQHITSDFSFGSQYINNTNNFLAGVGLGLATNSSNLVSSASQTESHQTYTQQKSFGLLAQEAVSFGQTLFLQAGARVDENSAFGSSYGWIFLPKAGVSYVMSQEPFWSKLAPVVSTLRLRAAYGTTGRSPTPGASLVTYAPFPFVTPDGGVGPGVIQASPGNPNLKPERGTEFEGGIDAGFFHERVGLELTYFDKKTSDLLLRDPLAPSLAFTENPFINAGKVDNRGIEVGVHGSPIAKKNVTWDIGFTANTLNNKLVSLGNIAIPDQAEISPDLTFRYVPGKPLAAWYSSKVVSVDTVAGVATVTNTPVYAGPQFPTFQANLANTVTLFHNLRLYALFTSQRGGKILNVTPLIQDLFGTSGPINLPESQGGYSLEEKIRRFGPFQTEDGRPVGLVLDSYLQPTDFIRLQEVSATLSLPSNFAHQLHASSASITLAGRNLHLWKSSKFQGYDPEVLSNTQSIETNQFATTEEFTVPQPRRIVVRLNLQF